MNSVPTIALDFWLDQIGHFMHALDNTYPCTHAAFICRCIAQSNNCNLQF